MNFARSTVYPGTLSTVRLWARSWSVARAGRVLTILGGAPGIPEGRIWMRAVVWFPVVVEEVEGFGAAVTGTG